MPRLTELRAAGIADPVLFVGCPDLADAVFDVCKGWPLARRDRDGTEPSLSEPWPLMRIQPGPDGFLVLSPFRQLIGQSRIEALSAVLWALVKAHYLARTDSIPVHCASFMLNGQLIGLAGASGMGKSTFTARLAAEEDIRIFGDDILLVSPDGMGEGVGVLPRLRPPLPLSVSARFRDFVETNRAPADESYRYVSTPRLAAFGEQSRLSAMILLDRRTVVSEPFFAPVPAERQLVDWVEITIASNCSGMPEHLERIAMLGSRVPMVRIVYSDLEQALALLRAATASSGFAPVLQENEPVNPFPRRYARAPGLIESTINGTTYLLRDGAFDVVQLNDMARALLALVDAELGRDEMIDLLGDAYPDISRTTLASDVDATLTGLAARHILAPVW